MHEAEARGERVAVVGAGRVGTGLAVALHRAGVEVIAVVDAQLARARRCAALSSAASVSSCPADLPPSVSYVIVAVPDDALPQAVAGMASSAALRSGVAVAHTCGVLASTVFAPLRTKGVAIASMHPIMTFSGGEDDWQRWKGTYVSLEGDEDAVRRAIIMLRRLEAIPVELPAAHKVPYHVACVLVSNYVVAVHASAVALLARLGLDEETATRMLAPLLSQTARNLRAQGSAGALTGPIVRGDLHTVEQHLSALQDQPDLAAAYAALGRVCVRIARQQNATNPESLRAIDDLLARYLSGQSPGKATVEERKADPSS